MERTGGVVIDVLVEAEGWSALADREALFDRAARAVFAGTATECLDGAELSVLLTDDKAIRDLNKRWRGKDSATNVLSFPAAPPGKIVTAPVLGDIALGLETVLREARDEDKTLSDHVGHLFVHGLLHILGHDHETADGAERMEALEIRILSMLGIANPYADADLLSVMADAI